MKQPVYRSGVPVIKQKRPEPHLPEPDVVRVVPLKKKAPQDSEMAFLLNALKSQQKEVWARMEQFTEGHEKVVAELAEAQSYILDLEKNLSEAQVLAETLRKEAHEAKGQLERVTRAARAAIAERDELRTSLQEIKNQIDKAGEKFFQPPQ